MTDAMAGGDRAAMEQRIVQRSLEDDAFRQLLLADPKAAVEQELGTQLPPGIRVEAVEEAPDTVYLVIPPPRRPAGNRASSPTVSSSRWPAAGSVRRPSPRSRAFAVYADC